MALAAYISVLDRKTSTATLLVLSMRYSSHDFVEFEFNNIEKAL